MERNIGLKFHAAGGDGGLSILVFHDETENATLTRTVHLSREEWLSIIRESGVILTAEEWAGVIEEMSVEEPIPAEISEESTETSETSGEVVEDPPVTRKRKRG